MIKESLLVGTSRCVLWKHGEGGSVIYWGVSHSEQERCEHTAQLLHRVAPNACWTLAAYEAENWNDAFSPWPAPAVFGREDFGGSGRETLSWLVQEGIPQVERQPFDRRFIGGYSLAGLFSLWAFYESGMFQGAASCSGSLWFPGWETYMEGKAAPAGSAVYLSLGDKEERTRNRAMAAVGDATRRQLERLKQDAQVRACTLQWQPGGHFSNVTERICHGFAWLLAQP